VTLLGLLGCAALQQWLRAVEQWLRGGGGGGRGDRGDVVTMMVVVEKKKVCLSMVFVSAVSSKRRLCSSV